MPHFLQTLLADAGVSAFITLLVTFCVERARQTAPLAAGTLARNLAATVEAHVAPEFRAAVDGELALLASDADLAQATVTEAAAHILPRIAPKFPAATIADVVAVLGDTVHAFVAGLAPATK